MITRKVNIQVGDVNDNAPTFHNQPYSVRIPEVSTLQVMCGVVGDGSGTTTVFHSGWVTCMAVSEYK